MRYRCDANDDANDDDDDDDDANADADDAVADDDAAAADDDDADDDIFHASGPFTMHPMCIHSPPNMLKRAPRRMQNLPMGNQHHQRHSRGFLRERSLHGVTVVSENADAERKEKKRLRRLSLRGLRKCGCLKPLLGSAWMAGALFHKSGKLFPLLFHNRPSSSPCCRLLASWISRRRKD
jgi:hypothetical protein